LKQVETEEDEGSDDEAPSLGEGFKDKHTCTDIPCLLVFIVAIIAFVFVFLWGAATGNTAKLSRGIDVEGRICGVDPNVTDRPLLYYCPKNSLVAEFVVDTEYPVCIQQCPTGTWNNLTKQMFVTPAAVPECAALHDLAYLTRTVASRYCIPEKLFSAEAAQEVASAVSDWSDIISGELDAVRNSWHVLVLVVVLATVLGYAYLFLLRAVARCLIWLCVLVAMAALIGFGGYLWAGADMPMVPGEEDAGDVDALPASGDSTRAVLTKVLAVALWALAGLLFCLACCCGRGVQLSIACVQTGTLVIWKMPLLLLSPLIKALAKACLAWVFIWGFIHLWATGEVSGKGHHRHYEFADWQWGLIVYYIFVSIWVMSFITALYEFAVAYAVAKYYAEPHDEDGEKEIECCGVGEGVSVGLSCHAGSLALGSAIIALFELVQKILEYVETKNQELGHNQCISCMLGTCLCCCKCLEGFVQFINKNAYIDIAITSNSFCKAVRSVMHIVIDHGAAMAILNGATVIFQIVGVVSITATCGLASYYALSTRALGYSAGDPALAVAFSCGLAFIVAWSFMAIFDVTTDTLLYCYCEDKYAHGHATTAPEDMRELYEQAEDEIRTQKAKGAAPVEKAAAKPSRFSKHKP